MSADRSSTIGRERETNAALAFRDVQEFVLVVGVGVHAAAADDRARRRAESRPVGRAAGAMLTELVEPGDGARCSTCARSPSYAAGHIPGSISVPVDGGSFGTKAGFVLEPGERIVLHALSAGQALDAAQRLWAVGILELEGYVLHPQATETLQRSAPDELKQLLEQR